MCDVVDWGICHRINPPSRGEGGAPEVDAVDDAVGLGRVEEVPAHHVDAHLPRPPCVCACVCVEVGGGGGLKKIK